MGSGSQVVKFWKKLTSVVSVSTLLLGLLAIIPISFTWPTSANAVALPACADAGYTKSGTSLTITPSHGKVMYIDTGVSPRIDAAYVGYRIKNGTGSALSGYWVSLTDFRGGVISLANNIDANQQLIDNSSPLPDVPVDATKTVYFLIKANISTRILQTHTVSIYQKRPDAVGTTAYSQCDFSFTKVAETIKAAANKVTSVLVDGSTNVSTPAIGQLVTVTVKGAAGVIGAGSADVGKILWFSPSAFSSFPTTSLRLESVKLKVANNAQVQANGNNKVWIYDERLLVTPSITPSADSGFTGEETGADLLDSKRYYENEYKFRVISRAASATSIKPIAQISSGTQIKHTDIAGSSSGTINTTAAPISFTVTKSAALPSPLVEENVGGTLYSLVNYTVTITNTSGSGTNRIDQIVDTPGSGVLFKTGTARAGGTTISDPIKITSENSLNPQPLHFIGPFSITSGTPLLITYQMHVPKTVSTVFTNTAVAYTGTQIISATASTISGATVTNGGSGTPTGTGNTTVTLTPVAVTFNATSVDVTTAVLNGTVDGNGQTPTYQFEWATNSSLASYTTITPSPNSVSGSDPTAFTSPFTGTSGTTYWYRIVAIKDGTRYLGEIVSFTLIEAATASVATTVNATSVLTTSATLNGTIDPNLQSITEVRFLYGTSSVLTGATSKILYELDEDGKETNVKVTLSGANPIDVAWNQTGLTNNTVYYFRIEATYTSGTVQNVTGSILSFKTGSTAQTITFNALVDQNFTLGGTYTVAATATSNLAITYTSETTSVCTVNASSGVVTFVTAGTCVITASQGGNATYAPAESVSRQFEILPTAPTAQTDAASSIGRSGATLNGTITTGGSANTTVTFTYSTVAGLASGTTTVTAVQSPLISNGTVTFPLSGLVAGNTYYYKVTATNTNSEVSGSVVNFTTTSPIAITLDADDKSKNYLATNPTFSFTLSPALTSPDAISSVTYTFASAVGTESYGPSTTVPTEAGTYTITPSAAVFSTGNSSDYAITYTTGTYTINQIAQATLTLANRSLSQSTTYTLTATGGSGTGAITYTVQSGISCTIAIGTNQLVTPAANGDCVVRAVKATDRNYLVSNNADGTMTINSSVSQVITFADPVDRAYSPSPFTVSPTASSNLIVTLTSSTTSICLVEIGTFSITMLKAGVCTLTSSQGGNGSFNAADPVIQSFTISKETRTIAMKSSTDGDAFLLSYVSAGYANWGLTPPTQKSLASFGDTDTKTYALDPTSTGCEVDSDGTTRFTGAGTCKVSVSITGDKYVDATSSIISFVIGKKDQTISFTNLVNMTLGDFNQDLVSSTNAPGLTVTLTVDPASTGICEIVSGKIRALTVGTCVVNSNQSGTTNYNPAIQSQQTFIITDTTTPASTPAPAPAPVYVPRPPTITLISAPEVCAVASQLTVTGTNLSGATVIVDGKPTQVLSSTNTQMLLALPSAPIGSRIIVVTNADGSASTSVLYKFINSPVYVNFLYPSTYQGIEFSYTFTATNTSRYSVTGVMPTGLFLDPLTGKLSGIPTVNGDFQFTIVASNFCDETYLIVYMFVDKAIPETFTCNVSFPVPRSNTISDYKLTQLRNCLDKVNKIGPATIAPIIFLSGGLPRGLTAFEALTHPRYLPIIDLIQSMKLDAQIYLGAFSGSTDTVELNVYWPMP